MLLRHQSVQQGVENVGRRHSLDLILPPALPAFY